MSSTPGGKVLVDFFDDQQASSKYAELKDRTRLIDLEVARTLNENAKGDALSLGGVWDHFAWGPDLASLTVVDMSEKMLDAYAPPKSTKVLGDFYELDLGEARFDTVVFPLVLHHVAEGSGSTWGYVTQRIQTALDLAARWLRPGGKVWIMEYCPHPAWTPLQSNLLPLTKRFLRLLGQPLVAMHTRDLYVGALRTAGFDAEARPLETPGFTSRSWYPLFMATPWLKVPFVVFPKPHIFVGTRPR